MPWLSFFLQQTKKNKAMEKLCEFCKALSPVVYCTADAAYLCLSCDAKVHSANALSYRHDRTLLCQSCVYHPAYYRCLEIQGFVCQSCDTSTGHIVSFPDDRKVVISSYMGSPSAKELAALWGFNLSELESNYNEYKMGSSTRETKESKLDNNQLLQQILDLKKLQLSGTVRNSSSLHLKDSNHQQTLNNKMMYIDHDLDIQESKASLYDKAIEESFLPGDLFWQCKIPAYNNESWFHNMQDNIGVCNELQSSDDVNIPDVDLTFQSFEELFGSEHNNENIVFSSADMRLPFDEVHSEFSSTVEDVTGYCDSADVT